MKKKVSLIKNEIFMFLKNAVIPPSIIEISKAFRNVDRRDFTEAMKQLDAEGKIERNANNRYLVKEEKTEDANNKSTEND